MQISFRQHSARAAEIEPQLQSRTQFTGTFTHRSDFSRALTDDGRVFPLLPQLSYSLSRLEERLDVHTTAAKLFVEATCIKQT